MVIQTKLRKWGNSVGVVIPSEFLRKNNLREGQEIIIEIVKKKTIKELFGSLKDWKIDSQKLKEDLRKDWSK